ncbi:MAG: Type 1 glutamine amidotransferase-like domain-containing protein [Propionibacteriaceae bacterium]
MIGTVLALGGGGFSTLDAASPLDDHLLSLTGAERPKVCFVPTASGDADPYIERFLAAFVERAETSVLSLFCHDPWGYRDPSVLLEWVGSGDLPSGYAVDQHTALVFTDGQLVEAVSEQPGHPAYRVERVGDEVVETELPVRLLA